MNDPTQDMNYRVWQQDVWLPREIVVAAAIDFYVARAAYREAVERFPERAAYLRQGARIIEKHEPA